MNPTVKRIVDLLFDENRETEESRALHEEILNNCQEHYADLMARGLSEDEAISEIVTSLKGMEDVIAAAQKPEEVGKEDKVTEEEPASDCNDMVFTADHLRLLHVECSAEEVQIEPSGDEQIHVINMLEDKGRVDCHLDREQGRLDIRTSVKDPLGEKPSFFHTDGNGSFTFEMQNLGSFLLKAIRGTFVGTTGMVRILLPVNKVDEVQVFTKSGDISMKDMNVSRINLRSASGDLKVENMSDYVASYLDLSSSSGDVNVACHAGEAVLNSLSGDVRVTGVIAKVTDKSTSGDVSVESESDQVNANTVSGDAEISCSEFFTSVVGASISGDVEVILHGATPTSIYTKTVSGEVRNTHVTPELREANINLTSVSGDITIR